VVDVSDGPRAGSRWRPLRERVATHRAEEVTRVGEEERSALPVDAMWADAVALYRTGLHPAIGLCIRHQGRVILDRTIGHVDNPPGGKAGDVATPDTPFNLFSASKILTGMVVLSLVEQGQLGLEDPAARYLPEFAVHGKRTITIRQLLNHTAGIPDVPPELDPVSALQTGRVPLEPLYDLRPLTPPGVNVAYHAVTSWFLLAEIARRITGMDLRTLAFERILGPLGLRGLNYGVPPSDVGLVAKHARTGPPVPPPMARIFRRTIGVDVPTAVRLTNEPSFLTAILPSANVIGTGRETTRFLQMLLNGGALDGVRVLRAETVRRAVTEVTPLQFDSTFGLPMRYGLGVMMGGQRLNLYGSNTATAFGHIGFSSVVVYADPARQLAVSLLNTGKPMIALGSLRWLFALQRIALRVPSR
jgi:CubicO group peptidase (beta-lactamase class C family)